MQKDLKAKYGYEMIGF